MFRIIRRNWQIKACGFRRSIGSAVAALLLGSPAFAQVGGDRVSSFLSNALSYAQGLGIFGAGFLVMWAVANIARERPSNGLALVAHCCCRRFSNFFGLSRAEPWHFDSNPLHAPSPFERSSWGSNWRTGDKPMLSKLDTPDFRNLMSVTTPQLDWDRAIRLRKIVYMFMGSMIVKETAYAIGMLALQDLLNFIGRAYAYEPTKTPIRLIVDEVGRLAFRGFVDLLSQAGGQGLMAVLAFQSVADLVSVLGPAGAQQILDNTNTKLWFRATDHATAKTFADIAGQSPLLTRRESAAYRPVLQGRAVRNRLAFDATFAQQSPEVVENLVREDWLIKLPRGHAFLYASGQTYKTRFPLMPEPKNRFPLEAAA